MRKPVAGRSFSRVAPRYMIMCNRAENAKQIPREGTSRASAIDSGALEGMGERSKSALCKLVRAENLSSPSSMHSSCLIITGWNRDGIIFRPSSPPSAASRRPLDFWLFIFHLLYCTFVHPSYIPCDEGRLLCAQFFMGTPGTSWR